MNESAGHGAQRRAGARPGDFESAEAEPHVSDLSAGTGRVLRVRAVRGATQLDVDERAHLLDRVAEMVRAVMDRNGLTSDELISVVFTSTPDVMAEFPAYAARAIGIDDVPLLCAQEIDVPGAMPRVVRMMAHVETTRSRAEIRHVYLHGAAELRTDLRRDG